MRRAKRIHNEHVAQCCHFAGKIRVVLFLAHIETDVFTHDNLAGFDIHAVQPVLLKRNMLSQQDPQMTRNRTQRKLILPLALCRPAKM